MKFFSLHYFLPLVLGSQLVISFNKIGKKINKNISSCSVADVMQSEPEITTKALHDANKVIENSSTFIQKEKYYD